MFDQKKEVETAAIVGVEVEGRFVSDELQKFIDAVNAPKSSIFILVQKADGEHLWLASENKRVSLTIEYSKPPN